MSKWPKSAFTTFAYGRLPDSYFPGWFFPGKTFPGKTVPGLSFFRKDYS